MLSILPIFSRRSLAARPSTYLLKNKIALQSTEAALSEKEKYQQKELLDAKPFHEIPGPKGLPLIGSVIDLLKNNRYYQKKLHSYFQMNAKKYGPIFKIKLVNNYLVFIYKPEDLAVVLQAEGKYPSRGSTIPWIEYRKQRMKKNGLLTRLIN